MKTKLTLIAILFSLTAMAQTTFKIDPESYSMRGAINAPYYLIDTTKIDTLPVYMMISMRGNGMNPIISQIGYSVLRRGSYKASYLRMDKTKIPENMYIVWMAVPRKEECTCK